MTACCQRDEQSQGIGVTLRSTRHYDARGLAWGAGFSPEDLAGGSDVEEFRGFGFDVDVGLR
jgi:hypothetical protein